MTANTFSCQRLARSLRQLAGCVEQVVALASAPDASATETVTSLSRDPNARSSLNAAGIVVSLERAVSARR